MAEFGYYGVAPFGERALGYLLAGLTDEVEVKGEVVDAGYLGAEHFAGNEEVAEVGFCVSIDEGGAGGVDWLEILFPFAVADVDDAFGGEKHAVASVAGGHYAVEHVDAAGNCFDQIDGGADAHEVAGAIGGEDGGDDFNHLVHKFGGLAYGEASDGVSFAVEADGVLGGLATELGVDAALDDGEYCLRIAVFGFGFVVLNEASFEPLLGEGE